MSEYSDSSSVSKFIGSSAGYIGYDDNKYILSIIKDNPNATIILDEIDKAQETPEDTEEAQAEEDTRLEELQTDLDEVNEELEEIEEPEPVTPDEPIPGDEPPAISDDDLIRITLPTPPVLNKSNDQESDGIENDFKNEIFNEDGTFNRDRTQELMESGKMTVDQFIKACGYDLTNEADRKAIKYKENGDFKFVLEDGTEISGNNTGYSTGYSTIPPYLRIYQDGEYSIIDEQKYDFKSEIFNEDGELDIDRTQELMESGEMTVDQFIKACGYDLRNEDDQIAINLTRSDTFEFELEDGTVVSGRDSWDFMGNPPFILLETPYGDYLIKEGSKEDSEDDSELE